MLQYLLSSGSYGGTDVQQLADQLFGLFGDVAENRLRDVELPKGYLADQLRNVFILEWLVAA